MVSLYCIAQENVLVTGTGNKVEDFGMVFTQSMEMVE